MHHSLPIFSGIFISFLVTAVITSVINPRDDRAREKRNVVDDLIDRDVIQNFISQATEEDGVVNPHLLFRDKIQDPLPVPDFNITTSGALSEIDGRFRNMQLHGLRQLQIRRVHINVVQMNISVEMIVSILRIDGLYDLDGTVTLLSATGDGDFFLNVTDTIATGSASIQRSPNGQLEVDEVEFNIEVGDIAVHFENLVGVSNDLLNHMSSIIFKQAKASMLNGLEAAIKKEMNARLQIIPSGFFSTSNSTTIFDDLLEQAGTRLRNSGMDPMPLPVIKESHFKGIALVNSRGRLRLLNGTLNGLSSLQRTGDIKLTYENNSVTLEASLGFENITGSYVWFFHALGYGPKGKLSISIGSLSAYISIRQELRTGSRPQILDLLVERIGYIWVDVDGMGTLDYLLEIFINIISNALKDTIANTTVIPVRNAIQHELDNSPVFLI